jgi:16S rRNA (guanine527-N7)-methyltransferase
MALSAGNRQTSPEVDGLAGHRFQTLLEGAGLSLDEHTTRRLADYRDLLYTANQTTNLTAVRDIEGIERRLILESLRLVDPVRQLIEADHASRGTLLDLGTGGGLPGMVLAIACPELTVFLLDATGKKVAFLDDVVQRLDLTNTSTIHARAEEVAHQPRYRNAFDLVTARAVSTLPALLELGLPFLRPGGHLILPKGSDLDTELAAGEAAARVLGGDILASDFLPDVGSTIETRLVIVRKVGATPTAYPRRAGIPAKSPLGFGAARDGPPHRGSGTT